MNFLLEYSGFDDLALPMGIILTNSERQEMCRTIEGILNSFYPPNSKFSRKPIEVDNMVILPEYLYKAVNNRTLLKKLVIDRVEIITGIKTKEDLFNFVKDNSYDLFHYNGKYFKYVYNLLSATSKKGEKFENKAFTTFEEYAKTKGMNIEILPPSLREDMYGGIDGIFFVNDKRYTIQVKPLFKIEEYKKDPTKFIVFCDGVLKDLKTDYLIVTNDRLTRVFRSKNVIVNPSFFLVPKENFVC